MLPAVMPNITRLERTPQTYNAPMLTLITVSLLGLLGALIGSFANVVIYRVPRGESIAFPGSHCPNCERPLTALDLVPIASWLALRGTLSGLQRGHRPTLSAG